MMCARKFQVHVHVCLYIHVYTYVHVALPAGNSVGVDCRLCTATPPGLGELAHSILLCPPIIPGFPISPHPLPLCWSNYLTVNHIKLR